MPKIKSDPEINETFKMSREYYPDAKGISDETFDSLSDHFKLFRGFNKLDLMFDRHNLTDKQKHFLTSLFFFLCPTRQSPEKNAELKEMVDDTYKSLGYQKALLHDSEFNKKVYQYLMLKWKSI